MTNVELSFVEPAFEGSLDVHGRISPGVLAFTVPCLRYRNRYETF